MLQKQDFLPIPSAVPHKGGHPGGYGRTSSRKGLQGQVLYWIF